MSLLTIDSVVVVVIVFVVFLTTISLVRQAGACWLWAVPRLPIAGHIINHVAVPIGTPNAYAPYIHTDCDSLHQ